MVEARSANDKVILALIGAGGRGTGVILSMKENVPNIEVKYVCEVDDTRGGRAIEELFKMQGKRPERIKDFRYALDDIDVDAVVICTPEHWHGLATIWACLSGKDVYVEKNISMGIGEGRAMVEMAQKYGRVVQCGTQNRSAIYNQSAKEYISSGKLGNIVEVKCYCMLPGDMSWKLKEDSQVPQSLDWNLWLGPAPKVSYNISRHKAWADWWAYSGGSALAGDASHILDLARMVIGDPNHPAAVHCIGGRTLHDDNRDIPDIQSIIYDYGSFPMSCISSKFGNYMAKTDPKIRYGKGFPDWHFNATKIEVYGTEGIMYLGRHGGGWQVFGGDREILSQESGMFPDIEHQNNFINAVRDRTKPHADVTEGHKSATLIHLANLSYRLGNRRLSFDAVTEKFVNDNEANELAKVHYRKGFETTTKK